MPVCSAARLDGYAVGARIHTRPMLVSVAFCLGGCVRATAPGDTHRGCHGWLLHHDTLSWHAPLQNGISANPAKLEARETYHLRRA